MGMRDGLRAAERLGARAGNRYKVTGVPRPNPFQTGKSGLMAQVAQAWNSGYTAAAYGQPSSPHPTNGPLVPGRSDASEQTTAMTAAARNDGGVDEWAGIAAAAGGPYTGCVLMLGVSDDDAARMTVPGGDPAEQMHVTLLYLAQPAAEYDPAQRAAIDTALAGAWVQPVAAEAFGTAHFNPDSDEREPAAVLLVQSDDLSNARDAMQAALEAMDPPVGLDETFPIWIPHVTIGYNLDPAQIPSAALGPVTFDKLIMAWGDEQQDITPTAALTAATTEEPMSTPTTAADPATDPATAVDPAATDEAPPAGPTWSGPLALIGVPSSDKRKLGPNCTIRPLPQPLNWQHQSDAQHRGSSVVGRALQVEIRGGQLWGHGDWLPGWNEDVDRARQQVDGGLGLVSVDTIPIEVSFEDTAGNPIDPSTYTGDWDDIVVVFDPWEFGGVTIVNFPAFADARISTDPGTENTDEGLIGGPLILPGEVETFETEGQQTMAGENPAPAISADGSSVTLADGTVVAVGDTVLVPDQDADGVTDTATITAINVTEQTVTVEVAPDTDDGPDAQNVSMDVPVTDLQPVAPAVPGEPDPAGGFAQTEEALLASSYSKPYTAAFFKQRELLGPTPLHVDEETREVWGHLGTFGECHIGKLTETGACVTLPIGDDFSKFQFTPINTDDGGEVEVGRLTVGTGHFGRGGAMGAIQHYDNTGTQVALVRAYYDAYGIQVTGQLVHGATPEKVDELRRSPLSGDWRGPASARRLVAALAVNVPGFPVRRMSPKIGYTAGHQTSLVAAGMVYPEETTDVTLPSGMQIPRADWDAMVAAAMTAMQQHQPAPAEVAELPAEDRAAAGRLALRRARARLAVTHL